MLRRIILCDQRDKLVATLETILKHWGYRVLAVSTSDRAIELLEEIQPNLFLVGNDMLEKSQPLMDYVENISISNTTAVVLINSSTNEVPTTKKFERLGFPFNIFELFSLVQKHLEKIPRKNLRLSTTLPGMLCSDDSSQLVDVLSLSSNGLFVKSGLRIETDQEILMILPLFGLNQEVEVPCRVLYTIQPSAENNYLQGFGVEFLSPTDEILESIHQYLEQRLLDEIVTQRADAKAVEVDQMQTHSAQSKLRLIMKHIN